ncbi:MAG: hypothetical protein HYU77_13740 [Betaproteobacteria bacterium]|nr:hypothetical protein [Betaproteobacteria bacterium]
MIRYWVFDATTLEAALQDWQGRLAGENGAADPDGAAAAAYVVAEFLLSPEARAHKMLIDHEEAVRVHEPRGH